MLGIVAAELRARSHPAQRLGPLVALGAAAAAFTFEPILAGFPGPASDPWALRVDPLWALALFGVLASAGGYTLLARALALRPLRSLGNASFAISLVAVPIAAFALRQSVPHLGPAGATVGAAVLALFGGLIFGQLVDRYFEGPSLRRSVAARIGSPLGRVLSLARPKLAGATAPAAEPVPPVRLPAPVPLAVVSMHSGSPEDLEAEILAAKRRLAGHVAVRELPAAESVAGVTPLDAAGAGTGAQVAPPAIELPATQAAAIERHVETAEDVEDMESVSAAREPSAAEGLDGAAGIPATVLAGALAPRSPIHIRIGRSRINGARG